MAFVRSKNVNGRRYYQLVENYREGGKHRQRVLAHLGKHPTLKDAINDIVARADALTEAAGRDRERARQLAASYGRRHPENLDQHGRPPWSHTHYWGCVRRADKAYREAARLEERYWLLRELYGNEQAFGA